MATFTFAYGSNRAILAVDINAITNDPANNRTLVRLTGRIYDGNTSLGGFGTADWNIGLDGAERGSGRFSYQFANQGISYTFFNNDYWIGHNANGSRSVYGYVNFNGNTGLIGAGSAGGTIGLTDYDRSPVFSIQTAPTPVIRGTSYTGGQFTASNTSSYTQTGSLPPGLTLNTSTGALTGTPNTVGSYEFTITANGQFESSASVTKTVVVNPPAPVFSDDTVSSQGIVGTAYSDAVLASDAASYSVLSGSLPDGLSLNTSTGAITGTPTAPGVFNFVIRATNVTGTADTGTLTITVLSGAKLWDGTSFVSSTTRSWDGTTFVATTTSVWNGSSWVSAK